MLTNEITYYEEEVNGYHFRMVSLPCGVFEMGDQENISRITTPVHKVELSPFCIGEFLVTQILWKAVMGGNIPSRFKGDQRPVEQVSWNDIVHDEKDKPSFLQKLNQLTVSTRPKKWTYRLPTEAEWEYAARADSPYEYSGGNRLKEVGWFIDNSHCETKEVGFKKPNQFGLYDMTGNVWEWCEDYCFSFLEDDKNTFYQECLDQGTVKNPVSRDGVDRVVRGGSWGFYPQYCRVADRGSFSPELRFNDIGFRLVLAPSSVQ